MISGMGRKEPGHQNLELCALAGFLGPGKTKRNSLGQNEALQESSSVHRARRTSSFSLTFLATTIAEPYKKIYISTEINKNKKKIEIKRATEINILQITTKRM